MRTTHYDGTSNPQFNCLQFFKNEQIVKNVFSIETPDIKERNKGADFRNESCPKFVIFRKQDGNYAHKKLHTSQKITIYQSVRRKILNKIAKQFAKNVKQMHFLCV